MSETPDCEGTGPVEGDPKPLAWAFSLTAVIFLAELVGGFWSGSLALLADAAHMAVDVAAIGIGLFAAWASRLPPDRKRSFGYRRVEVLGALLNGVGLWLVVGLILHEAWDRFQQPPAVEHVGGMLLIAVVGLVCNLVSGLVLFHDHKHSMNVRAVFYHVVSDALGSIGAIAAGIAMLTTGWWYADPLASVFICLLILPASFNLVREAVHILLEGAPMHLDPEAIRAALLEIDGVEAVHDLHLWCLTSGVVSMSGHLVLSPEGEARKVLAEGMRLMDEDFRIRHVTLQVEHPEDD
ncbi:MAG: cation diffusion facilitator family transporter [Elusimicrobiota bacterium]|jgi:cobalt-zinc-cadmium efflux system protein